MDRLQVAVKRFAKAFIAGGLASAGALLAAGVSLRSLDEAKNFGVVLATAFLAGGLMALEKAVSYVPEPQ